MMLVFAQRHACGMSEHREMVEEEVQERRREARAKVVAGNGRDDREGKLIVERQYSNGALEGSGWVGGKGEEKRQTAEDQVYLAEAKRDEEEKRMRRMGEDGNWRTENWQSRVRRTGQFKVQARKRVVVENKRLRGSNMRRKKFINYYRAKQKRRRILWCNKFRKRRFVKNSESLVERARKFRKLGEKAVHEESFGCGNKVGRQIKRNMWRLPGGRS